MVGTGTLSEAVPKWSLANYLERPVPTEVGIADPDSFLTYLKCSHMESNEGELVIPIPKSIQEVISSTPENEKAKMSIRIDYELINPVAGVHFLLPSETTYPNRSPHVYTNNLCGARCWMPCLDTTMGHDRCRWLIEIEAPSEYIVVASGLPQIAPKDGQNRRNNFNSNESSLSGGNMSSVSDSHIKQHSFYIETPVLPSSIGFAVGKFDLITDAVSPGKLTYYCLPGRSSLVMNTVGFMAQTLTAYEELLHSQLPTKHLKWVFVDDAPTKIAAYAGLVICSTHLLHKADIIDQVYSTRKALSIGLAQQWFPIYVSAAGPQDEWIISGLVGYLAYVNYQKMFGYSEFISAIISDLNFVLNGTRNWTARAKQRHDVNHDSNGLELLPLDKLCPQWIEEDTISSKPAYQLQTRNTSYTNGHRNPNHHSSQLQIYELLKSFYSVKRHSNDDNPVDLSLSEPFGEHQFKNDLVIEDFAHPLYHSNCITIFDVQNKYFHKRSTLVMIQLEKLFRGDNFGKLLKQMVAYDLATGSPLMQDVTTKKFLKACKTIQANQEAEFTQFAKNYLYQQGLPHLNVSWNYRPDSQQTTLTFKQNLSWASLVTSKIRGRIHTTAAINREKGTLAPLMRNAMDAILPPDPSEFGNSTYELVEVMLMEEETVHSTSAYSTSTAAEGNAPTTRKKAATAKKASKSKKMDMGDTDEDEDDYRLDDDDDDEAISMSSKKRSTKQTASTSSSLANGTLSSNSNGKASTIVADNTAPLLGWIRIDPELEWLRSIKFQQDEKMWIAQLENDRDVLAQLEAVNGLTRDARSELAIQSLRTKLLDSKAFFKLHHIESSSQPTAQSHPQPSASQTTSTPHTPGTTTAPMTPSSTSTMDISGTVHPAGSSNRMDLDEPHSRLDIAFDEDEWLKPNDFHNLESYFVQKAVTQALAIVRDENDQTPSSVFKFIVELLNGNDNSRNDFSDNYYVASLLHSFSYMQCDAEPGNYVEMTRQMERYLTKERMMPCYHNVIAQSCLMLLASLQENGRLDNDMNAFKPYLNEGYLPQVRATAIRCYLRIGIIASTSEASIDFALNQVRHILQNDTSVYFKHKTAFYLASTLQILSTPKLEAIFKYSKCNAWRKMLYDMSNSNDTSYYPRIRNLILVSLNFLKGSEICTVRPLPPRKTKATSPSGSSSRVTETQQHAAPVKKGKRSHEQVTPALPTTVEEPAPITPRSTKRAKTINYSMDLSEEEVPTPAETPLPASPRVTISSPVATAAASTPSSIKPKFSIKLSSSNVPGPHPTATVVPAPSSPVAPTPAETPKKPLLTVVTTSPSEKPVAPVLQPPTPATPTGGAFKLKITAVSSATAATSTSTTTTITSHSTAATAATTVTGTPASTTSTAGPPSVPTVFKFKTSSVSSTATSAPTDKPRTVFKFQTSSAQK